MSSLRSVSHERHDAELEEKNAVFREESKDALDMDSFKEDRLELERTAWRKLDIYILPIATMFYLMSFLDRSNIGNARVAGLQKDLGMSNTQYSMALTVTYIPYIAAEMPSNLLLKTVGPHLMLPTMVMLWGLVTTMQGLVTTYHGLLVCRFFLGLLEGGVFPGLVLYLSLFYPRERLNSRVATFFASSSLSGAFSGLLAAAIIHLNGKKGRPGWAWIFILEGIFTFLFALGAYFFMPGSVTGARFLSQREKDYVLSILREDGALSENEPDDRFSWIEVIQAFKSVQTWLTAPPLFFLGTTLYGLAYFEPTIVQSLGYSGSHAQLMSVPPFAVAWAVMMIFAFISDRYRARGVINIFASVLGVIGFSIFYATKTHAGRYASLFFSITGVYLIAATLTTWVANNSAPATRRATCIAIAFILTNSGGILATWLLGSLSPAPDYVSATKTFIIMCVLSVVFCAANLVYVVRENSRKALLRQQMSKQDEPKGLGDRSAWFVYST